MTTMIRTNQDSMIQPITPEHPSVHYPSASDMKALASYMDKKMPNRRTLPFTQGGLMLRTDREDVDAVIQTFIKHRDAETNPKARRNLTNMISRAKSVMDITPNLYQEFKENRTNMSNWLEPLAHANHDAGRPFLIPKTKVLTLPIELAQFIRVEYMDLHPKDRELFNEYIFRSFELDDDSSYFIKTGVFSSKFQFHNAHCKEPREMGDYFVVINNFAMEVGAGHSVELVVREWIEPNHAPDGSPRPTIYNGMPLRAEFRAFVDMDKGQLLGVVPYWHPVVMKRALKHELVDSIHQDFDTFVQFEDALNQEYNEKLHDVRSRMVKLAQQFQANGELTGRYSVDIMRNGDDLYAIDMAPMESSALVDQLPEYLEEGVVL